MSISITNSPLPFHIEKYIEDYMPAMDGWCSPQKADALARLVLTHKPAVIVEIGVWAGRSLIPMALAAETNDAGHCFGIDPWSSAASASGFPEGNENHKWWKAVDHAAILNKCRAHIAANGVERRITLLRATSAQALDKIPTEIDLLHIDGNHSEEQSVFDVTNYVPRVRAGGHVIFDDTNWSSTEKAQVLLDQLCFFSHFVETEGLQCGFYVRKAGTITAAQVVSGPAA